MRQYRCITATNFAEDPHPYPRVWHAPKLDYAVWCHIVQAIQDPTTIIEQAQNKQAELQAQGNDFDSDIVKAERKITEIEQERKFYTKQAAKGKMTEEELDDLIDETEEQMKYWREEIAYLKELRDDAIKMQSKADYVRNLLEGLQERLPKINQTPNELKMLPEDTQEAIMLQRLEIVQALCDKVIVHSDGTVIIEGLLDGSEVSHFNLDSIHPG